MILYKVRLKLGQYNGSLRKEGNYYWLRDDIKYWLEDLNINYDIIQNDDSLFIKFENEEDKTNYLMMFGDDNHQWSTFDITFSIKNLL